MNWAIGIDMYILMCIKLMTNKNLLYKKKKKPTSMLIKENKWQKKEGQPDFSINLLQTVPCEMYKTNCS